MDEELIAHLLEKNGGVLRTADVIALGISKDRFYNYVKRQSGLEKAAHGIYLSANAWTDEFYLLQARFQKAVYSHETALYLHGLAEKEPLPLTVTVPARYNSSALMQAGVRIVYVKTEWHMVGVCKLPTPEGHTVNSYDMERTVCDIIRKRSEMDVAAFNYAVREYVKRKDKSLTRLAKYAEIMHMEEQVRRAMGVLL